MKKPSRRLPTLFRRLKTAPVLIAVFLLVTGGTSITIVHADSIQQQIDNLNGQNNQTQNTVNGLQVKANSYQDAINKLQQKIAGIQTAIAASQTRQAELQKQIDADQTKINQQKQVLGDDLKAMYVGGQMTTVEMLATSKNLSSFVDEETYDSAVQGRIQSTLNQIAKLQNKLEGQKTQVTALLSTQQQQETTLSTTRAQQNNLLTLNQGQQASYTKQIQANNARINQLEQEQAAAERAAFSGSSSPTGGSVTYANLTSQQLCGGGYNFHCSGSQDNWLDQWGLYNRECVSYAAWYESAHGNYVTAFGYMNPPQGNAYQWHGVIAATGVASIVYYDQAVANEGALTGDVVYMPIGSLGHVGVVLHDEGGGWVRVGQYNLYDEGMYSEMDLKITPNLEFYHFH
ncbi:MAG TPA: CHAP domain-containing protein [Candidatus Saccharimonadales bacterium]